jgi:hypothetical protein
VCESGGKGDNLGWHFASANATVKGRRVGLKCDGNFFCEFEKLRIMVLVGVS